jgi:hypothetical protein
MVLPDIQLYIVLVDHVLPVWQYRDTLSLGTEWMCSRRSSLCELLAHSLEGGLWDQCALPSVRNAQRDKVSTCGVSMISVIRARLIQPDAGKITLPLQQYPHAARAFSLEASGLLKTPVLVVSPL